MDRPISQYRRLLAALLMTVAPVGAALAQGVGALMSAEAYEKYVDEIKH